MTMMFRAAYSVPMSVQSRCLSFAINGFTLTRVIMCVMFVKRRLQQPARLMNIFYGIKTRAMKQRQSVHSAIELVLG